MEDPSQNKKAARLAALASAYFPHLLPAERRLLRAVTGPEGLKLGPELPWVSAENNSDSGAGRWGPDREVRATLIRWLCKDPEAKALVDPRGIVLYGARITGELNLNFFEIPFLLALRQCRLHDKVSFVGCQIKELDLDGSWTGPISADRVHVTDDVWLDAGLRAEGLVSFVSARIGANLECAQGTRFLNKGGVAFYGDYMTVGGSVHLRSWDNLDDKDEDIKPFIAEGLVSLYGAKIGGDLDCSGGQFSNKDDKSKGERAFRLPHKGDTAVALYFERADVKGKLVLTSWRKTEFKVEGAIDLRGAVAGVFRDEKTGWPEPGDLQIDGFVYGGFDADTPKDADSRLKWLALDATAGVQPYRQLAKVLEESGDTRAATQVLTKMESMVSARNDSIPVQLLRASIGYGYHSTNAAVGLGVVTLLGALVTWRYHRMGSMIPTEKEAAAAFKGERKLPQHYPTFQPVIFSLEHTFPLVKLGQADKWQPDPSPAAPRSARLVRWFIWLQVLLGWLLATLFLAGISGIVRHIQ